MRIALGLVVGEPQPTRRQRVKEWIEPHERPHDFDCFLRLSSKNQGACQAPVCEIGIERNRLLEFGEGRIELALPCQRAPKVSMCQWQIGVELDTFEGQCVGPIASLSAAEQKERALEIMRAAGVLRIIEEETA